MSSTRNTQKLENEVRTPTEGRDDARSAADASGVRGRETLLDAEPRNAKVDSDRAREGATWLLPRWESLVGLGPSKEDGPRSSEVAQSDVVAGVARKSGGDAASVEAPWDRLPWVERFSRDFEARMGKNLGERDDDGGPAEGASLPRPGLPPRQVSAVPSGAPPPPPARRPSVFSHVPSNIPSTTPLPRFSASPLELAGPVPRSSSEKPPSLAPMDDLPPSTSPRASPWLSGAVGGAAGMIIATAVLWSPADDSRTTSAPATNSGQEPARVQYLEEVSIVALAGGQEADLAAAEFPKHTAQALGALAAEDAEACGPTTSPTEARVTFASDGSVRSVAVHGEERRPETWAACVRDTFRALRLPAFSRGPRMVRVSLR